MKLKSLKLFLLLSFIPIFSISAQELDSEILLKLADQNQISLEELLATAPYLVGKNLDQTSNDKILRLFANRQLSSQSSLGDLALVAQSLEPRLNKSLASSIFPSSENAFRDLRFLKLFAQELTASQSLSGRTLLQFLARYEEFKSKLEVTL